jgi:putative chitinase
MLSEAQLKAIYPRAPGALISALVSQSGPVFQEFGISALPNRLHYFLAQVGHESGGLTVTEENLNYSAQRLMAVWPKRFPNLAAAQPFAHNPEKLANKVYSNRMGNGPPESGDGFRYRGRGLIQITGKDGYGEVGVRIGLNLVGEPDRAAAPADALRVACGFWKWKNINPACDAADFVKVTKLINGGTVGLDDRRAWLVKVRAALAEPPPVSKQPSAADVRLVQLALRARGFTEIGAADGLLGSRTAAAISKFRQRNGMPPGLIDDQLLAVLATG